MSMEIPKTLCTSNQAALEAYSPFGDDSTVSCSHLPVCGHSPPPSSYASTRQLSATPHGGLLMDVGGLQNTNTNEYMYKYLYPGSLFLEPSSFLTMYLGHIPSMLSSPGARVEPSHYSNGTGNLAGRLENTEPSDAGQYLQSILGSSVRTPASREAERAAE